MRIDPISGLRCMPDEISDTYVHTQPDGTINFDFTGNIHAQGLVLDWPSGAPGPDADKIRWIDPATQAAHGEISNPGTDLRIHAHAVVGDSNLTVQADGSLADSGILKLISSTGTSRWLRTAIEEKMICDFTSGIASFPGGQVFTTLTIGHSLGVIPNMVLAISTRSSGSLFALYSCVIGGTAAATTIIVVAGAVVPAGETCTIWCMSGALG